MLDEGVHIAVDERRPHVWRVRFSGSPNARALSQTTIGRLHAALDSWETNPPGAVVIDAEPGAFCSGIYLTDLGDIDDAGLAYRFCQIGALLDRIIRLPTLTISVVEGAAVGAGADLAMACDVRIAGTGARLRFPGLKFGLVLGTARLAALTRSKCLPNVIGGDWIDATQGLDLGLFTAVSHDKDSSAKLVDNLITGYQAIASVGRTAALHALRPSPVSDSMLADLLRTVAEPGLVERARAVLTTA